MEGFDANSPTFSARKRELAEFLITGAKRIAVDSFCIHKEAALVATKYIGLLLVGEDEALARLVSHVSSGVHAQVTSGLIGLKQFMGMDLQKSNVSPADFLKLLSSTNLPLGVQEMQFPIACLLKACCGINAMDDSWRFSDLAEIRLLGPLLSFLMNSGFRLVVRIRRETNPRVAEEIFDYFHDLGVLDSKVVKDGRFSGRDRFLINFSMEETKNSRLVKFLVSVSCIANACLLLGERQ